MKWFSWPLTVVVLAISLIISYVLFQFGIFFFFLPIFFLPVLRFLKPKQTYVCPACGLDSNSNYCPRCGTRLT